MVCEILICLVTYDTRNLNSKKHTPCVVAITVSFAFRFARRRCIISQVHMCRKEIGLGIFVIFLAVHI
jgi:hypothetical protein